jgi:hypothetical protein
MAQTDSVTFIYHIIMGNMNCLYLNSDFHRIELTNIFVDKKRFLLITVRN